MENETKRIKDIELFQKIERDEDISDHFTVKEGIVVKTEVINEKEGVSFFKNLISDISRELLLKDTKHNITRNVWIKFEDGTIECFSLKRWKYHKKNNISLDYDEVYFKESSFIKVYCLNEEPEFLYFMQAPDKTALGPYLVALNKLTLDEDKELYETPRIDSLDADAYSFIIPLLYAIPFFGIFYSTLLYFIKTKYHKPGLFVKNHCYFFFVFFITFAYTYGFYKYETGIWSYTITALILFNIHTSYEKESFMKSLFASSKMERYMCDRYFEEK